MRLRTFLLVVFSLLLVVFSPGCKENVKEPAVAGSFYPSDPKALKEMVDGFLGKTELMPADGKLIALISPHAGYQFSGQVAAYSYKQLKKGSIDTVVLIGSSHYASFKGVSVYSRGSMKTPLGDIKINEKIASSLIDEKSDVVFYPQAFEKEHSIEVQLPFLQETLKDFKIVPVLMGSPTQGSFEHLTSKLAEILNKNEKAIIIASTDLSHYHDYATAVDMDKKILNAVERMSLEDIEQLLSAGEAEMCGGNPVIFTIAAARAAGATHSILYKYANSGDVIGDKGRVVGYGAMGIYKSELTKDEKQFLLSLARDTITSYVTGRKIPGIEIKNPRLTSNRATFVTIKTQGNLRGCIGNIQPVMPLYMSVIKNAVAASSSDRRFPPMDPPELKHMEIEISILSPLEEIKDINKIEIGRDGLLLVKDNHSGLLLPQIAAEFGWDRNTFLENLSLKAGLPKDAWKESVIYTFTAEIIK